MSFKIVQATQSGIKPLIALLGESDCGKTYSALMLARGMVRPKGKIVGIDTENRRMEIYSKTEPFAPFEVIRFTPPFSPARYCEAIEDVENSHADIGIIDSGSHEWTGTGGVLDMAAAGGNTGLNAWRIPKLEHAKFVQQHLMRSSIPWIICLRATYKSRQTKGTREMFQAGQIREKDIGATVIIKDDHTSPQQSEEFVFESTVIIELLTDHTIFVQKGGLPSLRACFPERGMITLEHGQKLARWCAEAGKIPADDDPKALKAHLWQMLKQATGSEPTISSAEKWLRGFSIIGKDDTLALLSLDQIKEAINKTEIQLNAVSN